MATYKVIQDIEAEDKLLGPLTLRQFVYAGIAVFCLWMGYLFISKGAAFLIVIILPFFLLSAFFAFPWSREQPTELWALARIRFLLKPRQRIWDQSGIKELVSITVPKRIEHIYSDGLSQTEVRSRLHALAETIDSRGWAVKNTAMSPYGVAVAGSDDRLIDTNSIPQDANPLTTDVYEDMLDLDTNPKAQAFDSMLTANAAAHHQQLTSTMAQASAATDQSATQTAQPADYWFLNQPSQQNIPKGNDLFGTDVVVPGAASDDNQTTGLDEDALTQQLRAQADQSLLENSHLPTLLPLAEQEKRKAAQTAAAQASATSPMTAAPDAAILGLAHNDDLNIETIARQAKKAQAGDDGEVVISLH